MSQDGTNFGTRHVQGAIISFHTFEKSKETDFFGSVLEYRRGVNRVALPLVHGANKLSKDVKRTDGTVHTPVTPETMALIVYLGGLMVILSHFPEILTLSLDGATENGRSGPGGEAMCGHNSPMNCLMIRQSIWKTVESLVEKLGLKNFLNKFYKYENPEELQTQLEESLRKERQEKRAAGCAKKAKKGGCAPDMSHAQEPSGGETNANTAGGRQQVVPECTESGTFGWSGEVGARSEAQEQFHAESSNMNQGGEQNASDASRQQHPSGGGRNAKTSCGQQQGDAAESTSSGESGCSDEDGAGADESDSNSESSVCSSSQDQDCESDTAIQGGGHSPGNSGGVRGQSAGGSGQPGGSAPQLDTLSEKRRLLGLSAPEPREPPPALDTQGSVKPFRKLYNNALGDDEEKYDYEDAVDELRRRHKFLRFYFQDWYKKTPINLSGLEKENTFKIRVKKFGDQTAAAVAKAAEAAAVAAPGVGGGGGCFPLICCLSEKLAAGINSLRQNLENIWGVDALPKFDKEIPSGVSPAGGGDGLTGAPAGAGFDPLGLEDDSAAAAEAAAAAANYTKAKLAQAVFRYRRKCIRSKSYNLQQSNTTKFKYWQESKSARFETRKNPLRYFACFDQRQRGSDSAWSRICTAAHCMHHRLHNSTKRFFICLNNGHFSQLQAAAACMKNIFIWSPLKGAIDLLLGSPTQLEAVKMQNVDTKFYEEVQIKVKENYEAKKGVSLDDVRNEVEYDPEKGVKEPKACIEIRWGTVANAASHLLSHRRLYLFGMIRRFSKCLDEPHVAAAVSVFSEKGFVSKDFPNVCIEPQVQRAFGLLSKIPELVQLAIVDFVNIVCIQPMLNGASSDNDCAVNEMMGVDSIPRRMIYFFERGLWLRTGMRGWNSKLAVLSRTDGGEFDPDPKSLYLLDVNCDVNSILGAAGNEKTRDAVKKLFKHFKMLANSGQEVMPDDLLSALRRARPARPASPTCSGLCNTFESAETSYASNMSKLMYVLNLVCADVVESLRCEFDREIYGIQGLCGGMIKQMRESVMLQKRGIRGENEIVSAHPVALANAFVLLVLAMDLAAHHAEELRSNNAEIEDFMPSYTQVLSKSCMDEMEKFLGIQNGNCQEVCDVPLAPEQFKLNKRFNQYEKRINGETTKLSMPLCWYPNLLKWSITAQCSCASSKSVEQSFSTPSILGRGKGNSSFRVVTGRFRMNSVKMSGLNLRKTESLRFKLARRLAKLRGWQDVFKEDRVKGDAMHVDNMRQTLPVYIQKKGHWRSKSHEESCRPNRFVNPAEGSKEQGYVERLTQKLCERAGTKYDPPKNTSRNKNKRSTMPTLPCNRKAQKSGQGSSAPAILRKDSERGDADGCSSAPVVSAAAREEASHGEDGGGESLECDESQVMEAAHASASFESAARADEADQIHPGNASLNVLFDPAGCGSFAGSVDCEMSQGAGCTAPVVGSIAPSESAGPSANPAASEGHDQGGGVEGEEMKGNALILHPAARADETDQGPPCNETVNALLPSAGGESLANSAGAGGAPEETKDADDDNSEVSVDGEFNSKWSIDFCFEIHNAIWKEGSDHRTWKESKVVYLEDQDGLYASITRRRGFRYEGETEITFNVRMNSSKYHYIMYDQWAGAMLVSVLKVHRPVGRDWDKTVDFRRVYTTDEARQYTDSKDGGPNGHMGLKALDELIRNDKRSKQTTYHVGDCKYSGNIKDMIGVVRWVLASYRGTPLPPAWFAYYPKADLIFIGPHVSERVSAAVGAS